MANITQIPPTCDSYHPSKGYNQFYKISEVSSFFAQIMHLGIMAEGQLILEYEPVKKFFEL